MYLSPVLAQRLRWPARLSLVLILSLVVWAPRAHAQGVPIPSGEQRKVEVDVQAQDGRLKLSTDGEATLVPPSLLADSPAAWPEGYTGPGGEVTLELLVDETGQVSELTVTQGSEPRLEEAARAAAPGLRFQPATLGGKPVAVRLPFVYRFQAPVQAPARAKVMGTVRAKGTRRPLADAALFLDGVSTPVSTDSEGRFTLEASTGAHSIEVRAPGHKPFTFQETLSPDEHLEVVYRLEPLVVNPYETVVRDDRPRTEVTRVSLHEQEIREVPGTQGDPFRVVMLMPGVGSLASGISYPVVRGSQPAATGFFLDGIRIPMLYHLLLGPAVVQPDFVDTIDFYPGTPPVRYGRQLGGAVEGRISRPREDRLHATVSVDPINSGVFVEAPIPSTGTSVSVAGRMSYSALLISLMSNILQEEGVGRVRANFWDYQARIEQKVGEGRLRLFALGSSDGVGVRPDEDVPASEGGGVVTRFHRVDLRGTYPLAGGEGELGITAGMDELGLTAEQGPQVVGEYALRQVSLAARALWTREWNRSLRLSVGADLEHRRAAVIITGIATPVGSRGQPPEDPLKSPSSLALFSGAHAELQWNPVPSWLLIPGVRADLYHLVPGITHAALEPRLTVRHAFSETLTFKGGAGLFHQAPTVLMHLPVVDTSTLRYGLQEGVQLDVGAEWKAREGLELSADAFYNPLLRTVEFDLKKALQNRRLDGQPLPDPSSSGYAYGFELMARHPLGRNWFGWASYSFLQSRRRVRFNLFDDQQHIIGSATASLPFAFEQQHVFNAALSYRFGNNYTVGTVVHFNTGRPESGEITSRTRRAIYRSDGSPDWGAENLDRVGRLPPYFRVDLRASKTWVMEDFTLEAYLDVLNISLQQEVVAYTYSLSDEEHVAADGTFVPGHYRKPVRLPVILPLIGLKATY
ncbi:TonB-dependent receptor domain-containing protein [Vitiosangium sp. GDMCC 1.1324]|uniref:TonB-dependent receptor domain-containing protein n=1 Tax=Vitiosangium sp. (strain GDMCC 1.1324) TaxID=2138576 RepID=UPI000D335AC0|nr:TonB-dependent receptor [Vitiosangium sp. GDMCC 1.1324]PTL81657.1 NB-dependent receptor [Vitiosangium sp. GDMCC 1.1324]